MIKLPELPQMDLLPGLGQKGQDYGSLPENMFQKLLDRTMQDNASTAVESAEQSPGKDGQPSESLESGKGKDSAEKLPWREEEEPAPNPKDVVPVFVDLARPEIPLQPLAESQMAEQLQDAVQRINAARATRGGQQQVAENQPVQQETTAPQQEDTVPILSTKLEQEQPVYQAPVIQLDSQEDSKLEEMLTNATQQLAQQTDEPAEQVAEEPVEPLIVDDTAQEQERAEKADTGKMAKLQPAPQHMDANPLKEEVRKASDSVLNMAYASAEPQPKDVTAQTQTTEPLPRLAQLPEQMEQIRVQVKENLEDQRMEFRMQLKPQELGQVDVRMVMDHGRLAVEIIAANPKAAELLTKSTEGLAASLRTGNIQVESVQVVTETQAASGQMRGAFNMDHSGASQQEQEQRGGAQSQNSNSAVLQEEEELAVGPQSILDYQV